MEPQNREPVAVETIIKRANELRTNLSIEEKNLRDYVEDIKSVQEPSHGFNKGECIAHAMLALRHIEDARMRIGKVIQYADGGVSVYDKK
jgi:hypothetical protein